MSSSPTAPDGPLGALLDDGYDVTLRAGHLVVSRVPYLTWSDATPGRQLVVKDDGKLVLPVADSAGIISDAIGDHQIWFAGDEPVSADGRVLGVSTHADLGNGLVRDYSLSFKPPTGSYPDLHAKVRSYARILRDAAHSVDPSVSPTPGAAFQQVEDDLPFVYRDTNTTRAGLTALNSVFRGQRVAIVGVGGTGAYILDQVAKTSVDTILLVDGDTFDNHNAFRAPGAAPLSVLQTRPNKAEYMASEYSRMHKHVVAHPVALGPDNLEVLADSTFVFLAAADAPERPAIMAALHSRGVPFIDVGMGLRDEGGGLTGLMKVTCFPPGGSASIPTAPAAPAGEVAYATNIQVADLNALNAVLAVIQWKKHLGFYAEHQKADEIVYKLFTNEIRNGEAS